MGKCGLVPLVLAIAGSVLCGGCRVGSAAQIRVDRARMDTETAVIVGDDTGGLKTYLAEGSPLSRTFQQFDAGRSGASPRAYGREVRSSGRVEGSLIGRVELPLSQYLDPHSRGENRPRVDWPRAGRGAVDGFFIEFKPALMEWPADAQEGETVEALAQVTAFEHDGVPFTYGTCRRTMRVVGFEMVGAGEWSFDGAVRMEADTELTFGWLATIRVHETVWFARGVGLVRREEWFTGRALWLFRFQGAGRYELADEVAARVETVADKAAQKENCEKSKTREKSLKRAKGVASDGASEVPIAKQGWWSRLTICFERSGRHIWVSGLAVEWGGLDGETAAPTKQR